MQLTSVSPCLDPHPFPYHDFGLVPYLGHGHYHGTLNLCLYHLNNSNRRHSLSLSHPLADLAYHYMGNDVTKMMMTRLVLMHLTTMTRLMVVMMKVMMNLPVLLKTIPTNSASRYEGVVMVRAVNKDVMAVEVSCVHHRDMSMTVVEVLVYSERTNMMAGVNYSDDRQSNILYRNYQNPTRHCSHRYPHPEQYEEYFHFQNNSVQCIYRCSDSLSIFFFVEFQLKM